MSNLIARGRNIFPSKGFEITPEILRALPPLYQEIAKVLIERGDWVLVDRDDNASKAERAL